MGNAKDIRPHLAYVPSAVDACTDADLVLHLTEWAEFRELQAGEIASVVAERKVVDGRSALDPQTWRAAGWTFRALGRP